MDTPEVREKSIMEKRKRRQFTKEFKAKAVRLVLEQKQPLAQAARDLSILAGSLSNWVKQAKIDRGNGPPGALPTEERTELAQLRREVRTLRMEREILKNYLARPAPSVEPAPRSRRSFRGQATTR
jgi:transposase